MGKKICQVKDGVVICEFNTITDAAKSFGVDESSIRKASKRGRPCCGYYWKIYNDAPAINYFYVPEFINETIDKPYVVEVKDASSRILVIGDLHEPFTRSGYLEFCVGIYNKYRCDSVIFIGDLIDNHFSSFHDTDPDGHGAARELELAKANIAKWYRAFPKARVCIGNHDLIPIRKSFNSGLSKVWIRSIGEVLNTPNWEYAEEFIIDNVLYVHGTGRKALNRMTGDLMSIVQGHYHSESYINYAVGKNKKMFAMQIGCGVDDKTYAMAYGRFFDKMHINCGVVLENGTLPILEYMNL